MKRLEIVCLRPRLADLVAFLQEEGVMHLEDVPLAVENARGFLHRVRLTEEQRTEELLLEELDGILGEITPLLPRKPDPDEVAEAVATLGACDARAWRKKARVWSRTLRSLIRRVANLRDNIEVVVNDRKVLEALAGLIGDKPAYLGRNAQAMLLEGNMTGVAHYLGKILDREVSSPCVYKYKRYGRHGYVAVVLYPDNAHDAVMRVLNAEGVTPLSLPDKALQEMPFPEMLSRLSALVEEQRHVLAESEVELEAFCKETGAELAAMRAAVSDALAQLRVVEHLAQSELVAVIHGWVPQDKVDPFENDLETRFGDDAVVSELAREDVESSRIPTLIRHSRFFEPFEVLLAAFKPPTYDSFDPTVLVGIFFVFFYGFILGDVAYGLVIFGLAYWLARRFRHSQMMHAAAVVAMYCGVSSMVFGVLFGELLGDLGQRFGLHHMWFHRGNETEFLLHVAVAVGGVHIVLSLLIGIREALRHHEWSHLGERMGMLVGLIGMGATVLAVIGVHPFTTTAGHAGIAGIFLVAFAILVKATGTFAPIHMLEVVSLVSNVLSYTRLMALGVASIVLAEIANELLDRSSSIVLGIVLATVVHVVNICIGIFSPAIHSLRLNYVEFLPKFYEAEGRSYRPFQQERNLFARQQVSL